MSMCLCAVMGHGRPLYCRGDRGSHRAPWSLSNMGSPRVFQASSKQGHAVITIDYFSDILCVWAYGGQIRLDELQREFDGQIEIRHRFLPLFADTRTRIGDGWKDQGGFEGFGRHMHEVCAQWEHTHAHPDIWGRCRPLSSMTAHVFLRALRLYLEATATGDGAMRASDAAFGRMVRRVRDAFFEEGRDVSDLAVLYDLLPSEEIAVDAVRQRIDSGEAYAMLHRDEQLAREHGVLGSPTYVFNAGRQLLYGNVGYRIIAGNVRELLAGTGVEGEPSWC